MSATTLTEYGLLAAKARLVAIFFDTYGPELDKLTYGARRNENPDVDYDDLDYVSVYPAGGAVSFLVHGANQRDTMKRVRRLIGGQWEKSGWGDTFQLRREWHPTPELSLHISIQGARDKVCQRRVVGTKLVERPPVEARPARTEVVEEIEWDCGTLLSDDERG